MSEKIRLPQRRRLDDIESVAVNKPVKKIYKEENFQLGVVVGVLSTVLIIILSLTIIGLIGAIFS